MHPTDVEEMDINWTMAMAVWRAKNFIDKHGVNKWGDNRSKLIGTDKAQLRCYNCHEKGHFARDCPREPIDRTVERRQEANITVPANSSSSEADP